MTSEMIELLQIRDRFIASLERQVSLQEKIIEKQQDTIDMLEEQLSNYQTLMQEMLDC